MRADEYPEYNFEDHDRHPDAERYLAKERCCDGGDQ